MELIAELYCELDRTVNWIAGLDSIVSIACALSRVRVRDK